MSQLNTHTVPLRSVVLLVFAYTDFQVTQEKKIYHLYSSLKPSMVLEDDVKVISRKENSKG